MTRPASIWSVVGLTLLLALGCAAGAPAPTTDATSAPPDQSPPGRVQDATGTEDIPATGARPGDRVPDFSLNLVDGATVSSQELIGQGRPTFLYFFATW